jgi:hypothetical protein
MYIYNIIDSSSFLSHPLFSLAITYNLPPIRENREREREREPKKKEITEHPAFPRIELYIQTDH